MKRRPFRHYLPLSSGHMNVRGVRQIQYSPKQFFRLKSGLPRAEEWFGYIVHHEVQQFYNPDVGTEPLGTENTASTGQYHFVCLS